jgi:hypothetical protein
MKRLIIILALLVAACSLSFAQTNRKKAVASAMGAPEDAITMKEMAVLEAIVKKDRKAFDALVASDAVLNGPEGRMTIADFVKVVFSADYSLSDARVEDPQVMMIDKNTALLTYKSSGTETYKGKTMTGTGYATTLWVKRGATWKGIFHQETPMQPMPGPGGSQ